MMDILYLSHCVPNPPDKGEKIRAHRELLHLCERFRVHLACFARSPQDLASAGDLRARCASVYAEHLPPVTALARAAARFAWGESLMMAHYSSRSMQQYVADLARRERLSATVIYTAVMAPLAPAGVPALLDLVDVDSEKWFDYARMRTPGFLYGMEARRYRRAEIEQAGRASRILLSTEAEADLFRRVAPQVPVRVFTNGVDVDYFDPARSPALPELAGRRPLVFVGTMDYYPNIEGVLWFASEILPELRRRESGIEFFVVGRNPPQTVVRLGQQPGITVTGAVPDVRPYLAAARAVVAPLRIARGIQNKVLEALSMGKTVLASDAICRTLGPELPCGVVRCGSAAEFIEGSVRTPTDATIRPYAVRELAWQRTLEGLTREVDDLLTNPGTSGCVSGIPV